MDSPAPMIPLSGPRLHPRAVGGVLAVASVLAAGCGGEPVEAHARGPSIVFVSIDTLAAGHTSLHGYPRDTTPTLRALADEGIVFDACWSNAAWTTPSYMAQLTGLYPDAHRVVDAAGVEVGGERPWQLFEQRRTLPELLRERGYRTAAFVDNPNLAPELGFDQGFEVYDTHAVELGAEDPEAGIRAVLPRGLAWLDAWARGGRDAPAFLFLQAIDPHAPYLPAADHADRFEGDGHSDSVHEAPVAEDWDSIFRAIPRYVVRPYEEAYGDGAPPTRAARYPTGPLVDAYDREIAATDAALGELVEALRTRGLLDEVVLVVSSDHGESMVEDDSLFSHQTVQEEVLHVPLLVRLPEARHGGTRVPQPVQLVDLFPTLLELAGADTSGLDVHGRSLVPAWEGGQPAPRPLYATASVFRAEAVRDGDWKLVRQRLRSEHANARALLSHPAATAWVERHLGVEPGAVVGTREVPLAALLTELPPGSDAGELLARLEAELGEVGPRLFRYVDGAPAEVAPGAHPEVVQRLERLLDAGAASARAARLPGAEVPRGELDAAERSALDHLGY